MHMIECVHTCTHTHTGSHTTVQQFIWMQMDLIEGSALNSAPHLFPHRLWLWLPCGTVLTGAMRNLSLIQHSDGCNFPHVIAADISRHQWTYAVAWHLSLSVNICRCTTSLAISEHTLLHDISRHQWTYAIAWHLSPSANIWHCTTSLTVGEHMPLHDISRRQWTHAAAYEKHGKHGGHALFRYFCAENELWHCHEIKHQVFANGKPCTVLPVEGRLCWVAEPNRWRCVSDGGSAGGDGPSQLQELFKNVKLTQQLQQRSGGMVDQYAGDPPPDVTINPLHR